MKTHESVSSSRRKARKAHFTAPSHIRRKLLSAHLSRELKAKYLVRSVPVRKGDEVKILRGINKTRFGKVTAVYRRRWCIHVEKIQRDKHNGNTVPLPIHPSNCIITHLKLDKDRKALLERKKRVDPEKGKYKAGGLD